MSIYLLMTVAFGEEIDTLQMSAEEAEIKRLRQEMNRFQESGSLQYSEKLYQQMLKIDSDLEWMMDADHLAGAMAANAKGDLAETLIRLERCHSSERAIQWRSFLWSETGPVRIQSQPEADLTIMMGLLNPDQIAALDFANQTLKSQKTFIGRLPNGAYQYGSQQFIVNASGIMMASEASEPVQINEEKVNDLISFLPLEADAWEVSVGGSVAATILRLGEGDVVETGITLDPRVLGSAGVVPSVRFTNNALYTQLELGYRVANNADTALRSFVPGFVVGTWLNDLEVALLARADFARLSFNDIGYIKRSIGYTYGVRGGYCPITNFCVEGQLETGVLGSHSLFGTGLAVSYHLPM